MAQENFRRSTRRQRPGKQEETGPMATLMIDVPPELESQLQEEAAKKGLPVSDFVRAVLESQITPGAIPARQPVTAEERAARVDAVVGKYGHIPGSVDEFLERKQEEIALEEEHWEQRQPNRRS
jgi:hypothetical protein